MEDFKWFGHSSTSLGGLRVAGCRQRVALVACPVPARSEWAMSYSGPVRNYTLPSPLLNRDSCSDWRGKCARIS